MNETNKIQKLLKRNKNRIEIKWKEWEKLSEKQRIEKIFNDSRFFGDIVCEICLTHYKTETEYILIGDHGLTNEMIDLDNDYAICKNCWYKIKPETNNKFEFILKKFKEAISEWEKDLESLLATLKQKSNLSEWKQWLDKKMYEEDYEIQKNEKNIVDEFLPFIKTKSESSNKNRIIKDYLISLVNKTYQDINNPKLQHAYQDILVVQNFLRAELDIYEKLEDSKKNNYGKDQVKDEDAKSSNSL